MKNIDPLIYGGILFLGLGLYGIYFQGDFWGRPVYGNYNKREITMSFYLPSFVTIVGLFMATIGLTDTEKPKKWITILFISVLVLVIISGVLAGNHAYNLYENQANK